MDLSNYDRAIEGVILAEFDTDVGSSIRGKYPPDCLEHHQIVSSPVSDKYVKMLLFRLYLIF